MESHFVSPIQHNHMLFEITEGHYQIVKERIQPLSQTSASTWLASFSSAGLGILLAVVSPVNRPRNFFSLRRVSRLLASLASARLPQASFACVRHLISDHRLAVNRPSKQTLQPSPPRPDSPPLVSDDSSALGRLVATVVTSNG